MSPRMSHSNYHKIYYLVARTIADVCKIAIEKGQLMVALYNPLSIIGLYSYADIFSALYFLQLFLTGIRPLFFILLQLICVGSLSVPLLYLCAPLQLYPVHVKHKTFALSVPVPSSSMCPCSLPDIANPF